MNILKRGIGLVLSAFSTAALAHQDPLGEVHPEVLVIDRQFHVFFTENSIAPPAPSIFHRVFDHLGTLVKDRAPVSSGRFPQTDERPRINLPEPLTGRTHRFAGDDYIIPEWPRKHLGKPFYLVADAKRYVRKNLQWNDHTISNIEDFVVDEKSLLILATRKKPGADPATVGADLWLFHFEKATGRVVNQQRLGDPAFIYDFPRTSRLDNSNGKVRVVWLEQATTENKSAFHLGTYDLAQRTFSTRTLRFDSHWNTSISIGVIADTLCVAYHGVAPKLAIKFIDLRFE